MFHPFIYKWFIYHSYVKFHCHVASWKLTLAKVTERSYARMDGGSIFAKNVPGQKMKIHRG